MKYILVSGGVVSGLGKGVTASCLGAALQACGLRVTAVKIDPYLNVDAGGMSPLEHGECFVLADGGETDLDLGNYERTMGVSLTSDHNLTTGKLYSRVLARERRGDYLGKTVQMVPHLTDAIQAWLERVAALPPHGSGAPPDVCLVELGGTVGDMEGGVYLEALRQLRHRVGGDCFFHVHVTLVPEVAGGEPKSKPTQHSLAALRAAGLHADLLALRSRRALPRELVAKICRASTLPYGRVVNLPDVRSLYRVPGALLEGGAVAAALEGLRLNCMPPDALPDWDRLAALDEAGPPLRVALVGKYTAHADAYLSVREALRHAALARGRRLELVPVDCETDRSWDDALRGCSAAVVPGGFGARGFERLVDFCGWADRRGLATLGICLGMQAMVVREARASGLAGANSTEVDPDTPHPVVDLVRGVEARGAGGNMRLGAQPDDPDRERYRHRYDVRAEVATNLVGLQCRARGGVLYEVRGRRDHTYVGVQYHPEFRSSPGCPHRLFLQLLRGV